MTKSSPRDRKVFAGPQIRRIRRNMELTQARMAEDLGISSSYQNLIERNQRPLTAQILLRLADAFDIDIRHINLEEDAASFSAIKQVFADPFFSDYDFTESDLQEVVTNSPIVATAVTALYRAYRDSQTSASILADNFAGSGDGVEAGGVRLQLEAVRDFVHDRLNHFPSLDMAAETLYEKAGIGGGDPYLRLRSYLSDSLGVGVQVMPTNVMAKTHRRYDANRRLILLSELLDQPSRNFQLATQIALLEQQGLIDKIIAESPLADEESGHICRARLARYYAGALLMPYERFLCTAEDLRYDCEALGRRFDTSFEQVCSRLTTMQRPGACGIPFFLVRLDGAGNVTKRFSPDNFPFARSGGTCPRWNVHETFRMPGQIFTQIVALPDGNRFFSIARTVSTPSSDEGRPEYLRSIGIGCAIGHADRLVYSNGCKLDDEAPATEIGINCVRCERADCGERAFPPLSHQLSIEENLRDLSDSS